LKITRPRSRLFCRDENQNQYFVFRPRGASRPKTWSRGLHHGRLCPLVENYRWAPTLISGQWCLFSYTVLGGLSRMDVRGRDAAALTHAGPPHPLWQPRPAIYCISLVYNKLSHVHARSPVPNWHF